MAAKICREAVPGPADAEYGASRLWLRDPESADPRVFITFVTRCAETFGPTGAQGLPVGEHHFQALANGRRPLVSIIIWSAPASLARAPSP